MSKHRPGKRQREYARLYLSGLDRLENEALEARKAAVPDRIVPVTRYLDDTVRGMGRKQNTPTPVCLKWARYSK